MSDEIVLDYSKNESPKGYVCSVCGATHVKLWRQYQTFLDHLKIMCARCAALDENADVSTINEEGKRKGEFGWTDQIGNLVPAIPTEEGDTYWGYTSVPQEGILWWVRLPTLSSPNRKNNI